MTVDVQNRIDRLMGILARECSELDVAQIAGLLTDLALAAERGGVSDERGRVLEAVQVASRRIRGQKGRGWREELDLLEREVEQGAQRLFDI